VRGELGTFEISHNAQVDGVCVLSFKTQNLELEFLGNYCIPDWRRTNHSSADLRKPTYAELLRQKADLCRLLRQQSDFREHPDAAALL